MLRAKTSHNILITRADKKIFAAVKKMARTAKFHELSGAITISRSNTNQARDSFWWSPRGPAIFRWPKKRW